MRRIENGKACAAADAGEESILASVEVGASPERVFQALASKEIIEWWIRPGVFDTREWKGNVRVRGRWVASGVANGRPYVLQGEFLEVDRPRKLAHTWHLVGPPGVPTVVTYLLEPLGEGTRITLRHSGFTLPETRTNTCIGWQTSFERLAEILAAEPALVR